MSARPKLTLTSVTDATALPQDAPDEADDGTGARSLGERDAPAALPAAATDGDGAQNTRSSTPAPRANPLPGPRPANEPDTSSEAASEPDSDAWRSWGPFVHPMGFKWPVELADELDDRRHDLREPVGLMVVAAVTHLLDQDDETIRRLIDRAEDAKPRDRRRRR